MRKNIAFMCVIMMLCAACATAMAIGNKTDKPKITAEIGIGSAEGFTYTGNDGDVHDVSTTLMSLYW